MRAGLRHLLQSTGILALAAVMLVAFSSVEAAETPKRFPGIAECVIESPKGIPIAWDVDVVVVGGSSGAVEAACEAARLGASVFLLAPRPYLGTDICSTLRLWLESGEQPKSKLAIACFGRDRITTPFAVKAEMDKALLGAGVEYLTGCYMTDVLRDKDGQIAGVVMANRSGRQAIRAKVVVDATRRAQMARQAGAAFRPFVPGPQTFTRVVVGGEMRSGDDLCVEKREFTYNSIAQKTSYRLPVYEYTLTIEMKDNSADAFRSAEQVARDMSYAKGSEMAAEVLSYLPSDTIIGEGHVDSWPGAERVDLGPFRPKGITRLYVLGMYADLGNAVAGKLMRPLELMELGRRIGTAAALEATGLSFPEDPALPQTVAEDGISLVVAENLDGIRTNELGTIQAGRRALPVLGRYDVVVVGGGTSGAPAGISAARGGAKTLVIEYLHELGGTGTVGLIGSYWYGLQRGYTGYVDEQVNPGSHTWNVVEKAEWLRQELRRSGADVWFGILGCGALESNGRVRGVVVATPQGRGAILASTIIDATGNADIAACAGAQTQYSVSEAGSLNVQIAGFPERPMKRSIVNTCYTMVDDTDVLDVWHLMVWKRTASQKAPSFDVGQLVDSRDRRRIVGDYMLTVQDILNRRTFPDTISQHFSNFDAAAFPDSRLLLVADAKGPTFGTDVPYRCLLPKGLDGILVVGLGCSAERDAMTLIRMQADMQNQGYAAGVAAAAAVRLDGHTREIDIKAVQEQLVREGVLDKRVYTDRDSYPMSVEEIEQAVQTVGDTDKGQSLHAVAVILAHRSQAIPLLKARYRKSSAGDEKLDYAGILGILGDATGVPTLIAAVDAHSQWDQGMALTSQRKTGNAFSDLDRLVIALGFSGAPEAEPALLKKLGQLKPDTELSHFKAISLALRHYHSPAAAETLVNLLNRPGFVGHATIKPIVKPHDTDGKESTARVADRFVTTAKDEQANGGNLNRAFKELIVAAMLYECGDRDSVAETILKQYATDIHGHFACYARRKLASTGSAGTISPFRDAVAFWQMKDLKGSGKTASELQPEGKVEVGVRLKGEDRDASLARGGDGYVAGFRGGHLATISEEPIQLAGKNASICLRLRDTSRQWNSGLLATADSQDRLANVIYANGQELSYRWRTTPPWERVEGIQAPTKEQEPSANRGTYGFNGESNDAHDVLEYESRKWICSVVCVHDNGRVVVTDQNRRAEKQIDIDRQIISAAAFYVGAKAGTSEFLDGDIAEILAYNRPLTDDETQCVIRGLQSKWSLAPSKESAKPGIPTEGLVLRLDAARAHADDSGRVSLWKDVSGGRHDMKQVLSARMPKRVDNTLGDLPVIHFDHGQFLQGPAVLAEGDDSFTIVGLWRREHLAGSEVLCEQNSPEKRTGRRAALLAQGGKTSHSNGWMRNKNFADGVLPVSAPVDWFGRDGWHDVIIRFTDTIIEFYVDGVLIDEEWPHGALYRFCSPFILGSGYSSNGKMETGFSGEIDHIAFWDRALTLQEIAALSGGKEHVARRDLQILGEPQKSIQYWKPRGRAYAGDCMVTCKDGEFHVFYLYDRLHHAAKWGLGAHQYGHFSSSDLKSWTHHPLAVPIDKQWECAMGTGNVIYNEKDGKWYAFYTDCGSRIQFFDKPRRGAWLFRSVSDDGIHFKKDFKPVQPGFDSDIFYVPQTGLFHLIAEGGRTHYQSKDLEEWTAVEDSEFRKTAEGDNLSRICPDTLAWNGWYYFTTGSSRIYKSRSPLGPWEEIPKNVFDGLFYSKMHEFKDGRALAAGWVGFPGWGGNIVVRELVQSPNGDLGLKFVPEMIPVSGEPLSLQVTQKEGDVSGDFAKLRIRAGKSLSYAAVDDVPLNIRIRLTVQPSEGIEAFGLCLRGEGNYGEGNELCFRPAENHVQFGHPHEGGLDSKQPVSLILNGDAGAMPPVTGLDKAFTVDFVARDRILDVCIDNRRTFIARRHDLGGERLFFFAKGGEVVFEQVEIRPLLDE